MTASLLGTPVLRVEDHHLLVGDTTFIANLDLPGALHAHVMLSTMAHARLVAIDTAEARAVPGVVDIVTGLDVELAPMPASMPDLPDGTQRPVLATDMVRFVGEPVVAIVADTPSAAADAAALVVIDYDPLPAVVDPEGARADDDLLFPDAGTNTMFTAAGGNDEPDWSGYEVVVEAEFLNQRVAPCPMETRAAAS
ncbi:MAG: xanthine dehydrogenase family protein molybdopterin-binding subunit, partial [Actinomycetia bacterium]|nr:xanthine dehydrogenase family protein molybdopterin-binding subunit [Actinomycetes bacterium]